METLKDLDSCFNFFSEIEMNEKNNKNEKQKVEMKNIRVNVDDRDRDNFNFKKKFTYILISMIEMKFQNFIKFCFVYGCSFIPFC